MAELIKLAGIYVAKESGALMERQESVVAEAGLGLTRDRHDDVTFIAERGIHDANQTLAALGIPTFRHEDTRRNLVLQGASPTTMETLATGEFHVGNVVFEGIGGLTVCRRPALTAERAEHADPFAAAFKDVGGFRARIVRSGRLRNGNVVSGIIGR